MVLFFRLSQAPLDGHIHSGLLLPLLKNNCLPNCIYLLYIESLLFYFPLCCTDVFTFITPLPLESLRISVQIVLHFCFVSKQILLLGGKLHWMCTIFTYEYFLNEQVYECAGVCEVVYSS